MVLYEENFPLYMTNFFYTCIVTLSLYVTRSIYNPIYIQRFFRFFPTHTYGSYKSFFIYTHCSHIQEFLSAYYLQKTFYTHFPFFFMYTNILFTTLLSFYHDFGSFYYYFILDDVPKKDEQFYTIPEFQQTLWTNNEANTNITIQTTCMNKTKINQNETNVSPLVKRNKMACNRKETET